MICKCTIESGINILFTWTFRVLILLNLPTPINECEVEPDASEDETLDETETVLDQCSVAVLAHVLIARQTLSQDEDVNDQ